jgi:hypothetical protein
MDKILSIFLLTGMRGMVKSRKSGMEKSDKEFDMEDRNEQRMATPPYVSYRTFLNFLEDMKTGIPDQIDRSVFPTMSGGTYNQLLPAIRYLGLVDASDRPKPILHDFVYAEGKERISLYEKILRSAYPFLFTDFDLMSASPKMLEDRFRENGASGETVRRCIVFFLQAAKDAEIDIGSRITARIPSVDRKTNTRPRAKPKAKQPPKQNGQTDPQREKGGTGGTSKTFIEAAMEKIPTFDPTWPIETQENYWKYVERVFGLAEKLAEKQSDKGTQDE